mgnify:FL=1
MPTIITQTQTGYDEEISGDDVSTTGDDVSTTSVTDNKAPENIEVEFHSTVRRFVQVSLEGNRIHHSSAKVRVRCHMREKKTVSKLTVSKAKAAKKVFRKVGKVAKKSVDLDRKVPKAAKRSVGLPQEVIVDPNYSGTLKLLKQMQFDNLMEWRKIAFKK